MRPKISPNEFRFFTVVSIFDKIVSTAIKIIFTCIYEKRVEFDVLPYERYLHDTGHGYRSGRSCHSALNVILAWGAVSWIVKADIINCYGTINQKRLVSILCKSIKDKVLMDTLCKLWKAPVRNLDKSDPDCSHGVGVAQSNFLSPILVNIYLNELDHFIENLKKELDKSDVRQKITPGWSKAVFVQASELSKAKTKKVKANLKRNLYREKVMLAVESGTRKLFKLAEPQAKQVYHKIYYVRYVDDNIMGVKGPKSLAVRIKKRVSDFLKSTLHFSLKENNIVHAMYEKVDFIGFDIKAPKRSESSIVEARKIINFKKIRNRLSLKKKALEDRYQKVLLQTYEVILKKKLKILGKGGKVNSKKKIEHLASQDAIKLHELSLAKNKNWDPKKFTFKNWVSREIRHLKESWVQEDLLREQGLENIITSYRHFIKAMENVLSPNFAYNARMNGVKRIIANPNNKQMHVDCTMFGQSRGTSLRIYAPIWEIKNRMKT